jgi:MFS-type transporter involved in bile tolerance (Atg22 family)
VYGLIAAEAALLFEASGMAALPAEQAGQRVAIASIAVFLLVGLTILLTVNEAKARQDAREAAAEAA